jgi:hypothetical protein
VKLELTPEEFRKLIELAYLGEWMVNAQHDPEFQDDAADAVVQRLLASPHEFDDVDQDVETNQYFMKSDWTEQLYDNHILDYDDHVFWDELSERLAVRDLARERGVPAEQVNRDDDLLELRPLEDRYRDELEEHGVERLEIRSDF